MKKLLIIQLLIITILLPCNSQDILSLQQCRELALRNNKQLQISKLHKEIAINTHNVAKTKYLPRVDGMAGYEHFNREISLLNNNQKGTLENIGNNSFGKLGETISATLTNLVQQGYISQAVAQQLGSTASKVTPILSEGLNHIGQDIEDKFRTDTKNIWAGSIVVSQPIYMGGAIKAANDIAKIGEDLAENDIESRRDNVIFAVDNAYWLAISLKNKLRLANNYRDLVKKLDDDVSKMIKEGVATRSDGLKVDVAVNAAEMTVTDVENGVSLAKMALCELCGIPLDKNIHLQNEDGNIRDNLAMPTTTNDSTFTNRAEIRMLQNTIDISIQTTKLIRAAYLPHVLLTGGLTASNPNVFNGFERKFKGVWNIGVLVQVPIWNWMESRYKVRASKAATNVAQLMLDDARNKITLQVEMTRLRVNTAYKKLDMARKDMHSAEENLRCANVGFKEGVMTVTDVMTAQTAWQQAETRRIDAEIGVQTAITAYRKALGVLDQE